MQPTRCQIAWTLLAMSLAACSGGSGGGSQTGGGSENQPPIAVLTLSKAYGVAPLAVDVDTAGSSDPDGTIVSVRIDFGDDATVAAASGSHTYTSNGGFTVVATVTDDDGATATATAQVVVSKTGDQTIVPRLVASRTSGYAPLAVFFDATGATSAVPSISDLANGGTFRQIKHAFDFGDPTSGTHSLDGMSRNSEPLGGGLAAHVFDKPGTYTVTVTSTDGVGAPATASVQITVDDPSSLPTYAISKTGDFTGAPPGSTHLTQSTLPTFASNSRYFFRRGEDWSGTNMDLRDPLANVHIDAYGSGAKPIFDRVFVGFWQPATNQFAQDIRVSNMRTTVDGFGQQSGSRVLFYKCDSDVGSGSGQTWHPTDQYRVLPQDQFENSHEVFWVDCTFDGRGTRDQYVWYGNGSRLVFLNTFMGGDRGGTARIVGWERGVMRHCQVESPYVANNFHSLKVHSSGSHDYDDNWLESQGGDPNALLGWKTAKVVVANTRFGGGMKNANWTAGFCPSNDGFGLEGKELMEDMIFEGNTFVRFPGWNGDNYDIVADGRRLTARANALEDGGAVIVGRGHNQPPEYSGPCFLENVPYTRKVTPCFARE